MFGLMKGLATLPKITRAFSGQRQGWKSQANPWNVIIFSLSALTLLVGRQDRPDACKSWLLV